MATKKVKPVDALLIDEIGWNIYNKVKIRVIEIIDNDFYPVKFEYKERGYKGLIFSARLNEIEYV